MKNLSKEIRSFLLENVPNHPKNIVAVTAEKLSVTRPTVHRHLGRMIKEGTIIKTGTTRGVSYYLKLAWDKELTFKIEPGVAEDEIWSAYFKESFLDLPDNVRDICAYGFTEILNNAFDHSAGESVTITTRWQKDNLEIVIEDNGIGIFRKLATQFNLENERESILQLSKGKLTTDPERHSGEGIYFTSRSVDTFFIRSHELAYLKSNIDDDWYLESRKDSIAGTYVKLVINKNSPRELRDIFNQFTTEQEDGMPGFDKTHILVKLSKMEQDEYISRSQAKRLLTGLEKFKHIILDFRNVKTVGQGFVDQVFRVFKKERPDILIEYKNENADVKFMIERGLTDSSKQIPLPFLKPAPKQDN